MKFLNETGLAYFLNKLKSLFLTITDFNKVYDNGVINVKQIIHKTNSDSSTNYDLTLGDRETFDDTNTDKGSYICINGQNVSNEKSGKNGNIYINGYGKSLTGNNPSIYLNAESDIHLNGQISNTLNCSTIDISKGITLKPVTNTNIFSQLFVRNKDNNLDFSDNILDISFSNGESNKVIHYETKGYNKNTSDKLQFLTDSNNVSALDIRSTQIKYWTDTFSIKKDKEIKFKTSSSNTMRLTEGEGFKVFANMYAMPDHTNDIEEYTDEEQKILTNNTVQKIILNLIKRIEYLEGAMGIIPDYDLIK